MQSKISVQKDYILVEPHDYEYWEILNCFGKLFDLPEYLTKSVLWKFSFGPIKIAFDDLDKIKSFVKQYYPKEADPEKKVAIVVESGLQVAMADEYVKMMAGVLPFKFKVFTDLCIAEKWILDK